MKDKNIIITGGLGFIGSHITNELIENNKITIIDNESSGKKENLDNPKHPNLTIIKEDINNLDLNDVLKGKDYVFHLAAMASVPLSINEPLKCNENNLNATIKLAIASKEEKIKKIIFSSSSAVYGENTNTPLSEDEPLMPNSPYAASKASSELYLQSFEKNYGLNSVSLRYFNVFGPKQDINSQYAAVIPNFIYALINNKKPVIYGDGNQTRDFIFIKDIVRANIASCESSYNGILNIASGKKLSINELFKIIQRILKSDIEVEYLDARKGDIKHSLANINKMNEINFKVDSNLFEKQLEETVKWFKNSY
jgi:UDP-glucose 4-epimerase